MKQLLLILWTALILSSCVQKPVDTPTPQPNTTTGITTTTGGTTNTDTSTQQSSNTSSVITIISAGDGKTISTTGSTVSVNYTLKKGSADGKVIDTSIESVAKSSGLFRTGAVFNPLDVILGQGNVIVGFEKGLMGARAGDKRTIMVPPQEWYGTSEWSQADNIPLDQIAPEFTAVRKMSDFAPKVQQTIAKTDFPQDMEDQVKKAKVGTEMTGMNGMKAKVIAVTNTGITIELDNTNNPFKWQEIKAWATASIPAGAGTKGADFAITKIEWDDVTLKIVNKDSPFYGKDFTAGASEIISTQQGPMKVTIKDITDTAVVASIGHPLADEVLFFEIDVIDVKDPMPVVSTPPATGTGTDNQ